MISMHCICSTEELFKTNGLALGLQNQQKTTSSASGAQSSASPKPVHGGCEEETRALAVGINLLLLLGR